MLLYVIKFGINKTRLELVQELDVDHLLYCNVTMI